MPKKRHRKQPNKNSSRNKEYSVPLWPFAVDWYMNQERIAGIYLNVTFSNDHTVELPGFGVIPVGEPGDPLPPEGVPNVVILLRDGAEHFLLTGLGQTDETAMDEVLTELTTSYVSELGEAFVSFNIERAVAERSELLNTKAMFEVITMMANRSPVPPG